MPRGFLNGLLTSFTEFARQDTAPAAPSGAGARIYTFDADGHTVLEGRIEGGGRFRFLRDQNLIGRNNTGATIAAGTFVRITGWDATAQVLTIAPADPSAESSMPAVGVVNAAVANGASGRVWQIGIVTGLNTGGMTVGGEIYLGASGAMTQTKPTASGARVQALGTVVVADTAAGIIHANVDPGYETIASGSNYRNLVVMSTDSVNANATANTLQDATGLSFPVAANTQYRFYFHIIIDSAATTTGVRLTLNGPTFDRLGYSVIYQTSGGAIAVSNMNGYNQGVPTTTVAYTASQVAQMWGVVRPTAAGTVICRFSSEVASSAVTIRAGSTVEYW